MKSIVIREGLGQGVASDRLSPMARGIAAGIGDGRPAPWAGFVWYRPLGLFQQGLHHPVEAARAQKAA
jgi:hypothetical protein